MALRTANEDSTSAPIRQALPEAVRWIAITLTFANLGIHLALAPDHLVEKFYIGVLFIIGSALLGAVMVGIASGRYRLRKAAWALGLLVCTVEFIAFVVSRTAGLPLGYREAWVGSIEDLLGLASLFIELVFICCAVISLCLLRASNRRATPVTLGHRGVLPR